MLLGNQIGRTEGYRVLGHSTKGWRIERPTPKRRNELTNLGSPVTKRWNFRDSSSRGKFGICFRRSTLRFASPRYIRDHPGVRSLTEGDTRVSFPRRDDTFERSDEKNCRSLRFLLFILYPSYLLPCLLLYAESCKRNKESLYKRHFLRLILYPNNSRLLVLVSFYTRSRCEIKCRKNAENNRGKFKNSRSTEIDPFHSSGEKKLTFRSFRPYALRAFRCIFNRSVHPTARRAFDKIVSRIPRDNRSRSARKHPPRRDWLETNSSASRRGAGRIINRGKRFNAFRNRSPFEICSPE